MFERIKNKLLSLRRRIKLHFHKYNNNSIILAMFVKNEADRNLTECITNVKGFIDKAIIIDDDSTDNTVELSNKLLEGIPHKIINCKYTFKQESRLRQFLWNRIRKEKCGWVLILDADEIFPPGSDKIIRAATCLRDVDAINLKMFDMWDEENFRDDELWNLHTRWTRFFLRIQPLMTNKYKKADIHPGKFPMRNSYFRQLYLNLPIKHTGWIGSENREKKYQRYLENDKNPSEKHKKQYASILDKNPNLTCFIDYCLKNMPCYPYSSFDLDKMVVKEK